MSSGNGFAEKAKRLARKHALINAIKHGGKASPGPVVGKVLAEAPELRPHAREVARIVAQVVAEVNKLGLDEQRRLLEEEWPGALEEKRRVEEEKKLPPLPNAEKYKKIVTRFAPNPDFVLHLGNARPAVLCHEYARMYGGEMILRFEDTDPRTKRPLPEAYKLIKEDLAWLGVEWDREYVQSSRMEIYYDIARQLIERGGAYVDICDPKEFAQLRLQGKACPHRDRGVEDQLEEWDKMLSGHYVEGEAVLRVKTDLNHPDPSVRDWVAFRIIDTSKTPHPLTGDRYLVWPTYNFAAGTDDHLMGVTHILRGKEHAVNTVKQGFLYKHMGWSYPETVHFGRLKLEGFMMSKSKIRELLEQHPGEYEGLGDPRFGTLAALRTRGFLPEAVRRTILHVGVKHTDAAISFDNLAATNRKLLDEQADRYMFVPSPKAVRLESVEESLEACIPYHPSKPEKGCRRIEVRPSEKIYLAGPDAEKYQGRLIRLMDLANFKLSGDKLIYTGKSLEEARKAGAPIIQWVPEGSAVRMTVKRPEGLSLLEDQGLAESHIARLEPGAQLQLFRYGFVKIRAVSGEAVEAYFTHK